MSDKPQEPENRQAASERFMILTSKLMQVPKAEVDAREAEHKKKTRKKKRK